MIKQKAKLLKEMLFNRDPDANLRFVLHNEVGPVVQPIRGMKNDILQNEIDRLLEASLTAEIKNCVLSSAEQIENQKLRDEIEKISQDSKDVKANLLKRIVILEHDFQRCQAQSLDFEL
ncbi:hypothetical protein Tco_0221484 [Tanacetum coccineum]